MGVPTLTSISPSSGPSSGGEIVEVRGTNFAEAVAIFFGDVAGEVLAVYQDGDVSVALVETPKSDPGAAVALVVRNLDEDGEPVAGEEATLADAYAFVRPDLTQESHLVRLIRTLLRLLKREILVEAGPGTDVDYEEDPDDDERAVSIAKVPSLTLIGPRMPKNNILRRVQPRIEVVPGTGGTEIVRRGPSLTVDLEFSLLAAARGQVQCLNLIGAAAGVLHVNPRISMLADADDPEGDSSSWPLVVGEARTSPRGTDGVVVSVVDLRILGFNLSEGKVLSRTKLVETVEINEVKI